jgi:hypothetical protein
VLSRIARGLCDLGRHIERAQHVVRILEVNHKMNLERAVSDDANVWIAIAEAFECEGNLPSSSSPPATPSRCDAASGAPATKGAPCAITSARRCGSI